MDKLGWRPFACAAAVLLLLAFTLAACGKATPPASRATPSATAAPTRSTTATASTVAAATPTATPAAGTARTAYTDVVTYRGDFARTGRYAAETALTATVASKFHELWRSKAVAGRIYAQPLVAAHIRRPDGTTQPLVLVATTADAIYALDARTGKQVWKTSIGTPVPRSLLACGDVNPVGILSTPVLDPTTSTLYTVGLVRQGASGMRYMVDAVNVADGKARPGYPVTLQPPASAGITFDIRYQQQRAALTLQNGMLYVPFGGYFGDCGPYHGWVVGVPTAHPAQQQSAVIPTGREGGIWSAAGLASAPDGSLYASTGNGSATNGRFDFGDAVVRFLTRPHLALDTRGFFAPSNFATLNARDADLASSTPVVLPTQTGTSTPHLLFLTGKPGVGYLLNRDALGGIARGNGVRGEGVYSACLFGPCGSQREGSFATAAYWNGGSRGNFLFTAGDGAQPAPCRGRGGVEALRLAVNKAGTSTFATTWCSVSMGDPGSPAVTGPDGGAAVVWVIDTRAGRLYALAARSGRTLWSAALGPTERFIAPAISGGRVFVGTEDHVVAYGAK